MAFCIIDFFSNYPFEIIATFLLEYETPAICCQFGNTFGILFNVIFSLLILNLFLEILAGSRHHPPASTDNPETKTKTNNIREKSKEKIKKLRELLIQSKTKEQT